MLNKAKKQQKSDYFVTETKYLLGFDNRGREVYEDIRYISKFYWPSKDGAMIALSNN